jgi:hypothetical protein
VGSEMCIRDRIPAGLQYKIMNVDDAHHLRLFSINMVNQQGAMFTKE